MIDKVKFELNKKTEKFNFEIDQEYEILKNIVKNNF